MQNIENDMDSLFRKAVEKAPLIPPASRWNEIAGKISSHAAHTIAKENPNYFKKISGVFVYLFSGAILLTILTTFITHQEIKMPHNSSIATGNSAKEKATFSKNQGRKYIQASIHQAQSKNLSSFTSDLRKENKTVVVPFPFNVIEEKQSENLFINAKNVYPSIPSVSSLTPLAFDILLQNHKSIELKENLNDINNSTVVNLHSFSNSRFYLSLTGGPLVSQIKSQGLKKTGFDIGLLIGYKINKKISVETGLLYSNQYYFSGGKYYNAATGGNTVSSMQGSRTAFEIPFKLNYYLFRNKSGGLYISGGLSSYVGVNDKIIVNVGENPQHPPQKLDYGVASYLPSYLDFSLGYDIRAGKSTHFKIEPYLQIPMNNTTGNTININAGSALQVYNAGLQLSISEFIH